MTGHVCPWWLGYLLASPIRRIFEKPEKILSPYIKKGMYVLEIGPGMGFFTLPMAGMVGLEGKIYSIDIQDKMLRSLKKRAEKKGLNDRIECRLSSMTSLEIEDLNKKIDFALAYAVIHEVSEKKDIFTEIYSALKPNARLLMADPKTHFKEKEFEKAVDMAKETGFIVFDRPIIWRSWSVIMIKP